MSRDRHVRLLPHAAWNAACSNHFLWRVEYALEGSQFWLILVLPLVFIQFEVMKLLFHAYIFIDFLWLLFLAGRIWPLMRLSIFFDLFWNVQRFFLLRLNNPLMEVLGSYAGVFRGARLSPSPQTPAQPRTTFLSQTSQSNCTFQIVETWPWPLGYPIITRSAWNTGKALWPLLNVRLTIAKVIFGQILEYSVHCITLAKEKKEGKR